MSLILTRALIPYELAARWEAGGRPGFADPYSWHQRSWECFPDLSREAPRDFLTRIDPKDECVQLLILSGSTPTRPAWCPDHGWQMKEIDQESFFSRNRYHFSLLANPTRKVRSNEKGELLNNSRRVPVTHREDRINDAGHAQRGLLSWLADHGKNAGFTLDESSVKTITRPRQNFVKPAKSGGRRQSGILHAVDFQGVLTVTDPLALRLAFATGIGSAKAFGFGMLCLSPI